MKFKGQANLYVRIVNKHLHRATNIKGITFNQDGIYETENPFLIKALSVHFETLEEPIQETNTAETIKSDEIPTIEVKKEIKPKPKRQAAKRKPKKK